jgi:hypothetical protein
MVLLKKYFIQAGLALIVLVLAGFGDMQPERPTTGFWAMEGSLTVHPFTTDKLDSLSGQEIYELRDSLGVTLWFGRHIFKDVCITGQCKMIRLWLFWDGAGNYLGFQIPEDEPLTKSDHTEFETPDYEKLHRILTERESILKDLKTEDLTEKPEVENPFEVDGYTAATKPGLDEVVVKDAVYTCHTLWHTVYGPTQTAIAEILETRISEDYLELMFADGKTSLVSWAITSVAKEATYHAQFYPHILTALLSDDAALSKQALDYFAPGRLTEEEVQLQLTRLIPQTGSQKKYDIIWKLVEAGVIYESVVLKLLEYFDQQHIGVGSLNLVYRLVQPDHLASNTEINAELQKLAAHDNAYIRNLTGRLLDKAK